MTFRQGVGLHALVAVMVGVLVLGAPPVSAETSKTAVQAPDPVKDAVVNLFCTFRSGSKRLTVSGSGVFISERGVILTNAHVAQYFLLPYKDGRVRGSCSVRTGSPARNTYTAEVLYISQGWLKDSVAKPTGTGEGDFALLYIKDAKGTFPAAFPKLTVDILEDKSLLEAVTIAGYPTAKLSSSAIRTKLKALVASSTVTEVRNFAPAVSADSLTIAPSAANASGVSGGPVLNSYRQVIGLATAVSSSKDSPNLRAITLPYINRSILAESKLPLSYYLNTHFPTQAALTKTTVSTSTLQVIKDSMFKKK